MQTPPRHDIYGLVHKGIRAAHMRCLIGIGATDPASDTAVHGLLSELTDHLAMCNAHLEHENAVIHTALHDRRPAATVHAEEDHDDHLATFRELSGLIGSLGAAPRGERAPAIAELYRRFAGFVADDLVHMDHEESVLLRDLQAVFSDDELRELEGRIVASIPSAQMALFMDAILGALPRADRDGLLGAMQATMPGEAFSDLMVAIERRRAARRTWAEAA